VAGNSIEQRGMEGAAENSEETSHSAHGSGVNGCKLPVTIFSTQPIACDPLLTVMV
jgi:hypothetical protein